MKALTPGRQDARTPGAAVFAGLALWRRCVVAVKVIALAVVLVFAGCATTSTPSTALTGDILVDGPRMAAEGPARDRVLWQYHTAAAAMRQGKFAEARPLLDDALLTLQGIYGPDA